MKNTSTRKLDFRRARTRTLVQLGGLIDKAGLTDIFDIELGQDLQQDVECFDNVAAFMGALIELKESIDPEFLEQQKMLWTQKGKEALTQE